MTNKKLLNENRKRFKPHIDERETSNREAAAKPTHTRFGRICVLTNNSSTKLPFIISKLDFAWACNHSRDTLIETDCQAPKLRNEKAKKKTMICFYLKSSFIKFQKI